MSRLLRPFKQLGFVRPWRFFLALLLMGALAAAPCHLILLRRRTKRTNESGTGDFVCLGWGDGGDGRTVGGSPNAVWARSLLRGTMCMGISLQSR